MHCITLQSAGSVQIMNLKFFLSSATRMEGIYLLRLLNKQDFVLLDSPPPPPNNTSNVIFLFIHKAKLYFGLLHIASA